MNENEKSKRLELSDDDFVVFIPDKDMRTIERVIKNIEQAQGEFGKIKDNMKVLDNDI